MSAPGTLERVRELLADAVEHHPAERAAFLDAACGCDEAIRREVESLLRAHESAAGFLGAAGPAAPGGPLQIGRVIGHYAVTGLIGAGGMGVVYAAKDRKLGRTVALKVLPAGAWGDGAQRSRLEREARLIANLQHPNIAAIHAVEAVDDAPVLVLEFVPGRTLAERLAHGRIATEQAIRIAREIADGLAAAHDAGIVHRDLKPANIKIAPDGTVKILDFGVAKPLFASSQIGPVTTVPGTVIGTPAYMSPEQARGQNVDRRTDLWALGTVLFEMLSGRRAFDGGTTADVLAAVIGRDPDWSSLPPDTPAAVRRLLRRCLEKDPDRRLRDAGDASLELHTTPPDPESGIHEPANTRRPWARAVAGGGVLLAVGVAAGVFVMRARSASESPAALIGAPARFVIDIPVDAPLAPEAGGCVALSPDGRTLVYAAGPWSTGTSLYLRRLDSFEAVEIPGTRNAFAPFFSPDGRWVAYCDLTGEAPSIMRVRVDGGVPEAIAAPEPGAWAAGWATGGCWGDDGTIVFGGQRPRGLRRVRAGGGALINVTMVDASKGELLHGQPCFLPGCETILFTNCLSERDHYINRIEAVRTGTGERRVVLENAVQPTYMAERGGRLFFYRAEALWSVGFHAESLATTGEPERLLAPLAGAEHVPYARVALSPAGTIAYLPQPVSYMATELAWIDRGGGSTTIFDAGMPINTLRLSPDGRSAAFVSGVPTYDVWVHDLLRKTPQRLSTDGRCFFPVWTPDGRRVAFQQRASEDGPFRVMWAPADGSSPPEVLFEPPGGVAVFPTEFIGDGRLAISMRTKKGDDDITDIFLVEPGKPDAHRLFKTAEYRLGARLSPDGALIAYTSKETGSDQVYIQPFPALDRKVRVSVHSGFRPAWSRDGRRLLFLYGGIVYEADVVTEPELGVSVPRVAFPRTPGGRFDVSLDGERLIMARPKDWGVATRINVVLGWNGHEIGQ